MNATPKGSDKPRRKQIEIIADSQGWEPDYQLPEIGGASYLVEALTEIGEGKLTGEGFTQIDWVEIKAWMEVTGAELSPGECEAIRRLSSVYVTQYYKSRDSTCPQPNIEEPKSSEVIESKIKGFFAMLRI